MLRPDYRSPPFPRRTYAYILGPAWSPDAARIAVSDSWNGYSATIRIVSVTTSKWTSVTKLRRNVEDLDPAWSPDGRTLAFVRRPNGGTPTLYLVHPDGSALRRLTKGRSPSWSPDGKRLAFVLGGSVYEIRTGGAGRKRILRGLRNQLVRWSPDGRKLLYTSGGTYGATPGDVWTADVDGTHRRRPSPRYDGRHRVAPWFVRKFSPLRGSVFARAMRVGYASLAAALIALILADAPLGAESESRGEGRIVFGFGESGALHPAQLAVMDGDGKHRRLLPLDHVFNVSWSRDGRFIVYDIFTAGARPNTYRRDVWTMNVDGRPRYRRVVRNGESADWSPSGREIAFVRGGDIWVVDPNDHRQRRIIRHGHSPRWSPDGKRLAFERGGSRTDIWVAELAAKKKLRLVRNGHAADWSPDGRQIVFERCRAEGGDTKCFVDVMRADGTAQRQLFEGQQPLWSPNGHAIAFLGTDKRRSFNDPIVRARLDGSGRRVLFGQYPYCGCYLLAWGPPPRSR